MVLVGDAEVKITVTRFRGLANQVVEQQRQGLAVLALGRCSDVLAVGNGFGQVQDDSSQQFSIQRFEYDEQGRQIRTSWFTVDDQPYVNASGYASMTSTYASDGTKTDAYFDAEGNEVKLAQ